MGNSHKLSNTNEKSLDHNSSNTAPNGSSSVENKISQDNYLRIKQVLNSLYKNNFEDLAAFYIQTTWKQHFITKIKSEKRGMIDLIYTTIERNPNVKSRIERIIFLLESQRYPFRCYDLVKYKNLKNITEMNGGYEKLPAVFINNYYIGSECDFQELHDLNLVLSIVNKEYLRRCLVCNIIKTDKELEICPYCYRPYIFFTKSKYTINVYENRFKTVNDK